MSSFKIHPLRKKVMPTQYALRNCRIFPFPTEKKKNKKFFPQNPSEKAAKIKGSGRINSSETAFLAPA